MDTFNSQEEQARNHFRACRTGACFACGLCGGKTHKVEWQSSRPNPLPAFTFPNEFYTPILLPGVYLPLNMRMFEIEDGTMFYTMEDPELALEIAAFLSHEAIHRHLLVGIVPMLMRLIASRCYMLLAYLKGGFNPTLWKDLISQNNIIEHLFTATAPLHEVVANVRNILHTKDNPFAHPIGRESIMNYACADDYGENFLKVLSDFVFIIDNLSDWFYPNPVNSFTLLALAEFTLLGAIDHRQVKDDLLTSPPPIPTELLPSLFNRFGVTYSPEARSGSVMENRRLAISEKNFVAQS